MLSVCPYFHVHQPYRVKKYQVFAIGNDNEYFNDSSETDLNNRRIIEKIADTSYRPMNKVLQSLLDKHPEFRFALSFSGTALDQFEEYAPDVLKSFQKLVASGRVEILADTYHHSLAFFYSLPEFERQVAKHAKRIDELFGQTPRVFRNTELSYRNDLAAWCEQNGYLGVVAEGENSDVDIQSANYVYRPKDCEHIKLLLKNHKLSDDLTTQFGNSEWDAWPLTAETYASWVAANHDEGDTINLFMDYMAFGEHQKADTGIFDFMQKLPETLLAHSDVIFKTPSETILEYESAGEFDAPYIFTRSDAEGDATVWISNDIQKDAIAAVYKMERDVLSTRDVDLIETWRKLQTSDHYHYMCTKQTSEHRGLSPHDSPYDAYIAFMNALSDLQLRVQYAVEEIERQRSVPTDNQSATLGARLLSWLKAGFEQSNQFFKKLLYKYYGKQKNS